MGKDRIEVVLPNAEAEYFNIIKKLYNKADHMGMYLMSERFKIDMKLVQITKAYMFILWKYNQCFTPLVIKLYHLNRVQLIR